MEIILLGAIIVIALVLFITEFFPIDVTALVVLGLLLIFGLVTPEQSLSGFSNPAVITIGCLFIMSYALQKSHVLEYVIININKIIDQSQTLGMAVYLFCIGIASAVVNNTAIVAIFMPVTIRLADKYNISPSKVLIPLSYAAILGGTLTLVGTSTNLIVNSVLVVSTGESLGMLEFAKFGIIKFVVGLIYIFTIGHKLLPSRVAKSSSITDYSLDGYLTEFKINENSPLCGRTLLDRKINENYDVIVLDVLRGGEIITSNLRSLILKEGDVLFVKGSFENFQRLKEIENLALLTDEKLTQEELEQEDHILAECLVTDNSELIGQTLQEANFRRTFGSFVLAIRREGEVIRRKLTQFILKPFDTLLVYGPKDRINQLSSREGFIVLGKVDASLDSHPLWWLSIFTILFAVIMAIFKIIPIVVGVILGVIALLLARVITPNEAYSSIHWQVIIVIAAFLPMGAAIQKTGLDKDIGLFITNIITMFPDHLIPYILLAVIYLITMLLTEIASNVATAIIMTPITLKLAEQASYEPLPFIFAVCYAASASFITPVGYQTNLMVFGPGGYKYSDYIKVGLPLGLILWIVSVIVIPMIWEFKKVVG
ncbi:MAG: SLC13 family permease [Candidatus Neomarinimicrobiota bacterium]|jgi:di/tricarboxylate transporter|nr:SLC13 family permease [Candidatus Neomarinimicrobiota bacterium]MEE3241593.1 SLC13 family permease [Candidatus Neomarinimicrobiota bacterium]